MMIFTIKRGIYEGNNHWRISLREKERETDRDKETDRQASRQTETETEKDRQTVLFAAVVVAIFETYTIFIII